MSEPISYLDVWREVATAFKDKGLHEVGDGLEQLVRICDANIKRRVELENEVSALKLELKARR